MRGSLAPTSFPRTAATASWTRARIASSEAAGAFSRGCLLLGALVTIGSSSLASDPYSLILVLSSLISNLGSQEASDAGRGRVVEYQRARQLHPKPALEIVLELDGAQRIQTSRHEGLVGAHILPENSRHGLLDLAQDRHFRQPLHQGPFFGFEPAFFDALPFLMGFSAFLKCAKFENMTGTSPPLYWLVMNRSHTKGMHVTTLAWFQPSTRLAMASRPIPGSTSPIPVLSARAFVEASLRAMPSPAHAPHWMLTEDSPLAVERVASMSRALFAAL